MREDDTNQGQQSPSNVFEDTVDIDVRDLFLMLWRRRLVILGMILLGVSTMAVILNYIVPQYTARTLILVETNANANYPKELQALFSNIRFDTSIVLSEIEVIRSRTMARRVVERLDLMADPEFNPRLQMSLNGSLSIPGDEAALESISLYQKQLEEMPPEVYDREIAGVISRFLDRLMVRSLPGSFAMQIEFTSIDPEKAALIANSVADTYIEQRLENKFRATKKLTDWLDKKLAELKKQVDKAETKILDFKAENEVVEGVRTIVSAEQLSVLNSKLVDAKADKAEAEARLNLIKEAKNDAASLESAPQVINSDLVRNLKLQENALNKRLSELSIRYGPKHPIILQVKNEIEEVQQSIKAEIENIAQSIENEVRYAKARIDVLQEGLEQASGDRLEDNTSQIRLKRLERDAASTQLIFETFLESYRRSDKREELQEPEAKIISYAIVPNTPVYPNKILFMSLSAAVSLFLGLAIAILLEKMDNTYRSANQLENSLGFPCYALIPYIPKLSMVETANYVMTKPSSTVAESVRTLRTVLNLRPHPSGDKPKVVTITSSFPGEGKSTLSVWMARTAAKSGEKVIVIDCDLRRPNVHRSIGKKNDLTIVEYLTGMNELDEVIQTEDPSGAHMIYARSVPNSALDLVSSSKMRKLVESLKQVYDLVILDSPACLAVSDARVLGKMSDQTLYAVSWDDTPREVVASGVKQFIDMDYKPLAFVLSNVDVRRHVRYGYGDTVYYYGRYKEYYAN